jgi:hypothetical protein
VMRVQTLLVLFGFVAFLWFVGTLRRVLAESEGANARLSNTAFGAGVAGVTLVLAGLGIGLPGIMFDVEAMDEAGVRAEHMAFEATIGLILLGIAVLFVFLAGASLAGIRFQALPRWLGGSGLVVAALGLVGTALMLLIAGVPDPEWPFFVFFVAYLLLLLWVLIASIVLTIRLGRTQEGPSTPPGASNTPHEGPA